MLSQKRRRHRCGRITNQKETHIWHHRIDVDPNEKTAATAPPPKEKHTNTHERQKTSHVVVFI
jgi:hypothetical protein